MPSGIAYIFIMEFAAANSIKNMFKYF